MAEWKKQVALIEPPTTGEAFAPAHFGVTFNHVRVVLRGVLRGSDELRTALAAFLAPGQPVEHVFGPDHPELVVKQPAVAAAQR